MLNKENEILNPGHGIGTLAQFAHFVTKPARTHPTFAPEILRGDADHWRRLVDLTLNLNATNPFARRRARAARLDWVEPELATDFAFDQVTTTATAPGERAPEFSIVIPFRDRDPTLRLTLRNLLAQAGDLAFEILLVDDASERPLDPEIFQSLRRAPGGWTLLTLPKSRLFRAGFARNVGALRARGESLVFLDSDILVGPEYLLNIKEELRADDLVQSCRWQIWHDQWSTGAKLDATSRDEPNPFWRDFHLEKQEWMALPEPWRYVSSNCLAMKRAPFLRLGGFRHWYSDYGFEDTDFGLRAWREGWRLRRSKNAVHHLAPSTRAEWIIFLITKRNHVLRPSARKFFLINQPVEALDWLVHLLL